MTTPIEDQAATIAELRERLREAEKRPGVKDFVLQILHGDTDHRAWLLDAASEFVMGRPVPPPSGLGRAEQAEARAAAAERTAIKRERQLADLETQNEAVRRALQQALKLAKEYGYDNFLGALAEFGWWKQAMDALGAPSPTIDATAAERALVERGAQVADLKEAWTVARKTLPPDRNLNAPWSQAIAIMDEAVDALPAPSPSRVAALVEAAKACANHPTMRAYPRTDEETLLIEAVDALEGA